jgi:hypothetical protein
MLIGAKSALLWSMDDLCEKIESIAPNAIRADLAKSPLRKKFKLRHTPLFVTF